MAEREQNGMNWLQKAAMWLGQKAFNQSVSLTDHGQVEKLMLLMGGGTTTAGMLVNSDTAMRAAAVWGCVRVLAETVGALPLSIYTMGKGGNPVKVDHDLGSVLMGSPNANMTPQEATESQIVNLAMAGNSYSIIDRGFGNRTNAFTPYPAQQFEPQLTPSGEVVYKFEDRGKAETLPAEKVWHVKGFGSNGLIGFSPVGYARQAIGLSLATEQFGAQFFRDGAKATGIITAENWLTDKQRKDTRETLQNLWQGLVNAHKVQLLEGGMKYQNVVMPLEDAQFLETRKFQLNEICRIYRVPPHMVADLERATFSNIEQQTQDFLQYTLLPYMVRLEQTANRRLFKPADRGKFFVKFNPEGLLRGDSAARSSLYSVLLQNGVINRNEARAKENLPRSEEPGMDDFTVQSNMALVQLLEAMARDAAQGGGKNGTA